MLEALWAIAAIILIDIVLGGENAYLFTIWQGSDGYGTQGVA